MMLIGLDVHEGGTVRTFRYDLPVTYVNFIGLPESNYFQQDYVIKDPNRDFGFESGLDWFKE